MKMENKRAVLDTDTRNSIKYVDKHPDPIGEVPAHRVPVLAHRNGKHVLVGNISRKATEATAIRLGVHGAKLGQHEGRTCWIEKSGG